MKTTAMCCLLVAAALLQPIAGLLHRSHIQLEIDPLIACGREDILTPYQQAYLDAYYKTASQKLFQADGRVSEEFRKLDLNGNGVLDCAEMGLVTKKLDSYKEAAQATTMLHSQTDDVGGRVLKDAVWQKVYKEAKDGSPAPPPPSPPPPTPPPIPYASFDRSASPSSGSPEKCTPQCKWACATRTCDQVCAPKCQAPQCQTRCSGMNTNGCKVSCGKPRCAVVCPSEPCADKKCPICQTRCSKPMCKLECPVGTQDCRDVCENPSCSWKCTKPLSCPRPACKMTCDTPKSCRDSTYKELPDLKEDETIIQSFETPLSLQQHFAASGGELSVPVAVTQAVAVPGSSELKLVHSTIRLPIMSGA